MNNERDAQIMDSYDGKCKIVNAHFRAIEKIYNGEFNDEVKPEPVPTKKKGSKKS